MSKYLGIDEREIKCSSDNANSIESGISFDEQDGINVLRFHFLDYTEGGILIQKTKSMHLDKKNTSELISRLKSIKFKK